MQRAAAVAVMLAMVAPGLAAAAMQAPFAASRHGDASPWEAASVLLDHGSQLPGAGPRAAALASLAAQALRVAAALAQDQASPEAALDAIAALREAQSAAFGIAAPPPLPKGLAWSAGVAGLERAALAAPLDGLRPVVRRALALGLPEALPALPPVPRFAHAADAVDALAAAAGVPLSDAQRARIAALRALPPGVDEAVARIVALQMAHADAVREALARGAAHGDDGPDRATLLADRAALVEGVLDAAPGLLPTDLLPVVVCGVVDLDLLGADSSHDCDVALSIDVGGDDQYHNNAGGADANHAPAALALDLAGNDTYRSARTFSWGLFGGAFVGSGALLDLGGDDVYDASIALPGGANGGAFNGVGFLLDAAGNDTYRATFGISGGANGGGQDGAGLLLDGGGDDIYVAQLGLVGGGNGGAGPIGEGVLVDLGGDDAYEGNASQGGLNGGSQMGQALLLDAAGDDTYAGSLAISGGIQGGSQVGEALLLDEAGNDTYRARIGQFGGANGGTFQALGVLVDRAGRDRYDADVGTLGGANGGADLGMGVLLDEAGDDTYTGHIGEEGGANGGALQGIGMLIDRGGANAFTARASSRAGGTNGAAGGLGSLQPGSEFPVGLPGGVGLLMAGEGNDTYDSDGLTQGAADLYGLGLLLDDGGNDTFLAGPGGLAQGAGRSLGVGLLVDRGVNATLQLRGNATGQGAALQGVGLVLRPDPTGLTTYLADAEARPGELAGAGVGMRIDLGSVDALRPPAVACVATPELLGGPAVLEGLAGVEVHVCLPDEATSEPLLVPITGQPLGQLLRPDGRLPKPGVPCRTGPLALLDCDGIVGGLLGEDAVDWLERDSLGGTTSGGLGLVYGRSTGQPEAKLAARYVMDSADETCDLTCTALRRFNPM